jgi:hypothetical protein
MFGGGGLKRPRPKLGCSAIEEEENNVLVDRNDYNALHSRLVGCLNTEIL